MIFQLKNGFKACRTANVFQSNKYTVTKRADADTMRVCPALVKVTNNVVLAIAGIGANLSMLSSVSSYNIRSDIWCGDLPPLNIARDNASACILKGKVYVFCGMGDYRTINTIEEILET